MVGTTPLCETADDGRDGRSGMGRSSGGGTGSCVAVVAASEDAGVSATPNGSGETEAARSDGRADDNEEGEKPRADKARLNHDAAGAVVGADGVI